MSEPYLVSPHDLSVIVFRLCLALVVGATIGLDRELRHKPAGLRTHMLVSFGSALFVLIPLQLVAVPDSQNELSRVIQGIASGVGFLGAGVILHESQQELKLVGVHGLTTAAAIWVVAALGIAAGCGLWQMSLIGALMSLVVLRGFKSLESGR